MEEVNFKVPYTKIKDIIPHPNADRLEICLIYGYHCITTKGMYSKGENIFYVPIDSVIPQQLEDFWFPPGGKIDRSSAKRRIRQINIRSVPSQGMILSVKDAMEVFKLPHNTVFIPQMDYSSSFSIVKYEPPTIYVGEPGKPGKPREKKYEHPLFHQYNGLSNIKWYPEKFKSDEIVVVQEKLHGTNFRCSLLPYDANTWWKKIKQFFGFVPQYEYCFGSNKVQLQNKGENRNGYYKVNIYEESFKRVKHCLNPGISIYGEIIGWAGESAIQKNGYEYCLPKGEFKLLVFDVKITQANGKMRWLNPIEVEIFCKDTGLEMVPVLYKGPFNSMEFIKPFSVGNSVFEPKVKVREGCVVKSLNGYDEDGNKRALKFISEVYLGDKKNSDEH